MHTPGRLITAGLAASVLLMPVSVASAEQQAAGPCDGVAALVGWDLTSGGWVVESQGTISLKLLRLCDTTVEASVNVAVSGTATPGDDYATSASTVVFSPDETEKPFDVVVQNDAFAETAETIVLTLTSANANTTVYGPNAAQTVTIQLSDQQPDAMIRASLSQPYLGGDLYSETGAGQTSVAKVRRTKTWTFRAKLQNDGTDVQYFVVWGAATSPESRTRYYLGTEEITGFVLGPYGYAVELGPNDRSVVRIMVKVRGKAEIGSKPVALLGINWSGDAFLRDVVRARVRVVR